MRLPLSLRTGRASTAGSARFTPSSRAAGTVPLARGKRRRERPERRGFGGLAERVVTRREALDGFEEGPVRRAVGDQSPRETRGDRALAQLEGVAVVSSGQGRLAELMQRDPAEGDVDPDIVAATLQRVPERVLSGLDGVLVPGGFDYRGSNGKIDAIRYARERKIPFFGICLGLQCAVIEFARNVIGLTDANSTEFANNTPHPVVCMLDEQFSITDKGGTMRLGKYPCILKDGSLAQQAYDSLEIEERHRHRFEFNNQYRMQFEANGLIVTGTSPNGKLVEVIELLDIPGFWPCNAIPSSSRSQRRRIRCSRASSAAASSGTRSRRKRTDSGLMGFRRRWWCRDGTGYLPETWRWVVYFCLPACGRGKAVFVPLSWD